MDLPHRYPFRWLDPLPPRHVDSADGRRVYRLQLTATAHAPRLAALSPIVALEFIAQAAGSAGGGEAPSADVGSAPPRPGMLAAISSASFDPSLGLRPLQAGDVLDVEVDPPVRFGGLVKVSGRIARRGQALIEADLVLSTPG